MINKDYILLIHEWFSDCTTAEEAAHLYAELLCEMRGQLKFCLAELQK